MNRRLRRLLLSAVTFISLAAASGQSYEVIATCPYDGEDAYFTDARPTKDGHTVCEYTHRYYEKRVGHNITHEFWIRCGD